MAFLRACIAGMMLLLSAGFASAQRPQVDIDWAQQTASQTVRVQVDVVLPPGQHAMRFVITLPDGSETSSMSAPAEQGLNQVFAVLFTRPRPPGSKIRAEIVSNPGGTTTSDTEPVRP